MLPARYSEPQIRTRASGEVAAIAAKASATEAAVVASMPALPAASAVTSAGSVFFSPGIDTACSRVAWPAKGRM